MGKTLALREFERLRRANNKGGGGGGGGGELTLQLAWLAGLELVTFHGSEDLLQLKTGHYLILDLNSLIFSS